MRKCSLLKLLGIHACFHKGESNILGTFHTYMTFLLECFIYVRTLTYSHSSTRKVSYEFLLVAEIHTLHFWDLIEL